MEMAVSAGALRQRGHRAAEKLGPQLGGVVQPQLDAALEAGPHGQDAGAAEHPQSRQHLPCQRGHHAAQNAALDLGGGDVVERKQVDQPDGVFVHRAGIVGVEPPAEGQAVLLVAAYGNVCVAYVDRQDHLDGLLFPFELYNVII